MPLACFFFYCLIVSCLYIIHFSHCHTHPNPLLILFLSCWTLLSKSPSYFQVFFLCGPEFDQSFLPERGWEVFIPEGEPLLSGYTTEENKNHGPVHDFLCHPHPGPVLSEFRLFQSWHICAADAVPSAVDEVPIPTFFVLAGLHTCKLEQTRVTWEREPQLRNCAQQFGLWAYLWGFCLIND